MAEQLDGGIASHILDLIGQHHRSLAPIRQLEIAPSSDASALVAAAERLLAAIEGEQAFTIPVYAPPTPSAAPDASFEPEFEMSGPWDPCDGVTNIPALLDQLMKQGHTHLTVREALYKTHPHLFKSPQQVAAMNAPLAQPETGVWKVPMIGDTTTVEPAEPEFSHA